VTPDSDPVDVMDDDPYRAATDLGHSLDDETVVEGRHFHRCDFCGHQVMWDSRNPGGFGAALEARCERRPRWMDRAEKVKR
jgi:hypothetical protein